MPEISQKQNIFFQFIFWYFFEVPREISKAWRNYLLFYSNYFSIPLLLRTYFSYWRRYRYFYGRGFDLKRYFEVWSFNAISRIIGAIMRTFLIIIGISVEILVFFLGLAILIFWFILPLLLLTGLLFGFKLLL